MINIENFGTGKGSAAEKIAIPFEVDENTFLALFKYLNR